MSYPYVEHLRAEDLQRIGRDRMHQLVKSLTQIYTTRPKLQLVSEYLWALKDYAIKHSLEIEVAFDEVFSKDQINSSTKGDQR